MDCPEGSGHLSGLLELGPRVKRALVQIPVQLTSRLVHDDTLVTGVGALAGRRAGSLTSQGAGANVGVGYRPVPMRPASWTAIERRAGTGVGGCDGRRGWPAAAGRGGLV